MNTDRHSKALRAAAALFAGLAIHSTLSSSYGQQPGISDVQGVEVLTRGPVHEAFAGIITFDAQAGVVVNTAPPALIEELPPDEWPEGDDVAWIPGYWAWDDERSDFLWISGTWRALPPGREWNAGYWSQIAEGNQWTSGYWSDAEELETVYLPPPPATVEVGPNVAAPSVDHGWTPGCWTWREERYAWRPGYWAEGRSDWNWVPAHYVWTPRGHVFVDGYWDYPVLRRGVLFAPVHFDPAVYRQRDYRYSPAIAINPSVFSEHLFLRPRYQHCYFGDYYDQRYERAGYFAPYSFHSRHRGYDPIYAQRRWYNRKDKEWNKHMEESYRFRRDHESERPPRTWMAQRSIKYDSSDANFRHRQVGTSYRQLAGYQDGARKFRKLAGEERKQIVQRGREVERSRDQRRKLESQGPGKADGKETKGFKVAKVSRPKSPIAAKSGKDLAGDRRPPERQRAGRLDPKNQPGKPKQIAKGSDPRRKEGSSKSEPKSKEPSKIAKEQPRKSKEEPKRSPGKPDKKATPKSEAKPKAKPAKQQPKRSSGKPDKKAAPRSEAKSPPSPKKSNTAEKKSGKSKEESNGSKKESGSSSKQDGGKKGKR
ncbi:MAG: hypothetical protein ACI9R3_004614 [Verrucomicrobiales bacterium]|jgi:hypothetical protein